MSDLFESTAPKQETYSAQDIQVLEGLEAVRARPVCILAERMLRHFTILLPKFWITPWMKPLPAMPTVSKLR